MRLVLIGGISAVAATGCGPGDSRPPTLSANDVYTNNFYVAGVGYYHAPFRAWYRLPYNHYDSQNQRYFYGGQWAETACLSITNISSPTPLVARQAEAVRTDIPRGGFGSSSHYYWIGS